MTITVTFEAETAPDLQAQIRGYIEGHDGSAVVSKSPPGAGGDAGQAKPPTNEDYRTAIGAIPKGKVAAYSTVSEVVRGDSHGSQKVAGLAANDPSLQTAYRVVKQDGSIAAGFRWGDRMAGADEGRKELEKEGVRFDVHGRALPEHVLSVDELRQLCEDQQ
jgi:alkylated DNA nucleotide flippase Atl1